MTYVIDNACYLMQISWMDKEEIIWLLETLSFTHNV